MPTTATATPEARGIACVNCRQPMKVLPLARHYGGTLEVDLCEECHLLWFDGLESVNLGARGVLDLLRAIHAAHGRTHQPLAANPPCPRCSSMLNWVKNQTAHGPTGHHECPRGHGALQTFSLYLAEKGLVRPLFRPEIEQLRKRPEDREVFRCLNCGGTIEARSRDACTYCGAALHVVDLPRLVRAVDRQTGAASPVQAGRDLGPMPRSCVSCGGSVDPTRERRCGHCAMPVVITDLPGAMALIEPLVPAIEEGTPTADHRLRRLAESLDSTPVLPRIGRRSFFETQWWIYFAGALFMMALGLLLVHSSR